MGDTMPSRPRWGFWVFLLWTIGLLALAAVGTVAVHEFRYGDRIYEGVRAAGIPLGGLTQDEAIRAVRDGLTPYPGAAITVRYGDRVWSLAASDLGAAVDAPTTAAEAFAIGRRGLRSGSFTSIGSLWQGLRDDLITQWRTLDAGASVTPTLRFDQNRLAFTLKRIADEVDLPPREGSLTISGLEVSGTPGQPGRSVNQEQTRTAIAALLQTGQGGAVDLAVEERLPAVMAVDQAVTQAAALLGTSLSLVAEGLDTPRRFAVDPATLRQWLTFVPTPGPDGAVGLAVTLDREQVTAFVQEIAAQLDRPAFDARLDFDPKTSQVVVLQPSQAGQQVDVAAAVAAIEAAVMDGAGEPGASAAAGAAGATKVISLPLTILQPRVDSNKIADMGIVEQVSEGTTYFKGSSRERVQNIVTAASKFRGTVIPPDEEFSFNTIVGDVTAANGFVDSLIILGDRTETGVGGGVCQVSTTAFRAAFWGGFPVLERYPHSYVVSWYGEPGMDASIYTPDADFRFRNDTGHYLLIQPEIDTAKGRITFHFYGTKPDRTVETEKPVITNVRDAPAPLYKEDATLPAGTIKQVDWAKSGMDVVVKRNIQYGDGRVKQDKFVSKYRPWQAVYLYGPGTALPAQAAP